MPRVWEPHEGEGWELFEFRRPPPNEPVEFHSVYSHGSFFGRRESLPPELNANGLYWRQR